MSNGQTSSMMQQPELQRVVDHRSPRDPAFATEFVAALIQAATRSNASDVHLTPTANSLRINWRLDGVLQFLTELPGDVSPNIIARLKVMAGLLTYETALPQEGRVSLDHSQVEVRLTTFPTLYGERAVLRLLTTTTKALASLGQLDLPLEVRRELEMHLTATSGAVLISGPAGSGKTTTAYACLRHIVSLSQGGRSIASLEDPIEASIDYVAQSQVNPTIGLDMATGLRSLLRLDPEVIFIGEMRDLATAEVALQAALTGQLVVSTFHAGTCEDAVRRLIELGIPRYAVQNALRLIVNQRLLRKLCNCAVDGNTIDVAREFNLEVATCRIPVGCGICHQTGYSGRTVIADWTSATGAESSEHTDRLRARGIQLIESGVTSPQELIRVLGLSLAFPSS